MQTTKPNHNIEPLNHQIIKSSENQTINTPLFQNTDVPLASLFIHLEHGYTVDQFLQDFPSVTEEQVQELLELAIEIFKKPEIIDH